MAFFLLEIPPTIGGRAKVNDVMSMVIEAADALSARKFAQGEDPADFDWDSATTTELTAGQTPDYAGWTYRVRVRVATTGGGNLP